MIATAPTAVPGPTRRRDIAHHLTSAYAYDRVAAALYEVLVDAIDFSPCQVRRTEARDWLRAAVAEPLRLSSDIALATLRCEVERAFDAAPPVVADWLDERRD